MNGPVDVVDTPAEAAALPLAPLVVRRPLEAWLEGQGLGAGPLTATRIGAGHSNATFLLERGALRARAAPCAEAAAAALGARHAARGARADRARGPRARAASARRVP